MQKNKIVAIHQPNFFPWLGFFHKYLCSDIFIVGDAFQQPKTDGNWTTRVQLLINKEKAYISRPINRKYKGIIRVNEIKIDHNPTWVKKTCKTIEYSYKKAPFFNDVIPFIDEMLNYQTDFLWKFNYNTIFRILEELKLDTTKIILQSDLNLDHLWKTELNSYIIELTKAVGGNIYLSGDGSDGYQEESYFKNANIELQYTHYDHPIYEQFNTKRFVPGLSIIDCLMNIGFENTRELLLLSKKNKYPNNTLKF